MFFNCPEIDYYNNLHILKSAIQLKYNLHFFRPATHEQMKSLQLVFQSGKYVHVSLGCLNSF